jgi:hypothetical protein
MRYVQLINEFNLTKREAFAIRLAFLYMELSAKYFPDYKHYKIPRKGDPRKCELFRYCWKLMNETRLQPHEYRHYIQSQMSILKNIKIAEGYPYIHPNCLVGEKAWRRWCVWQKYFNEVKKVTEHQNTNYNREIKKALKDDHYVLTVRLGELSNDKLLEEMDFIWRLNKIGVVSPYFFALNPVAKEWLNKSDKTYQGMDFSKRIDKESLAVYKDIFREIPSSTSHGGK